MSDLEKVYRKLTGKDRNDPLLDKNGNIIYCPYCLRPPNPKKVPATVQGKDGPRCAPCGRWVD